MLNSTDRHDSGDFAQVVGNFASVTDCYHVAILVLKPELQNMASGLTVDGVLDDVAGEVKLIAAHSLRFRDRHERASVRHKGDNDGCKRDYGEDSSKYRALLHLSSFKGYQSKPNIRREPSAMHHGYWIN